MENPDVAAKIMLAHRTPKGCPTVFGLADVADAIDQIKKPQAILLPSSTLFFHVIFISRIIGRGNKSLFPLSAVDDQSRREKKI